MLSRGLQFALRTLVLLLIVAFATQSFAHRLRPAPDVQSEIYAATYGVSAADLCGGGSDQGVKGKGCEACRLLASFHMPPVESGDLRLTLVIAPASPAMVGQRMSALRFDAAGSARAPPAV